jgi:hypothetical protein
MMDDDSKEAAEKLVTEAYDALCEARRIGVANFVKALQVANKAKVSDRRISDLIKNGYSRARIGQLRLGQIGKRDR